MCEHPIYVQNKTKRYCDGLTKAGFWVPCGRCESCRRAMQEEWFCRAYAEFLEASEHGGTVYFVTLTYDPKSRPMYNPDTNRLCHGLNLLEKGCIPVFDKKDIDRYRNILKHWFQRRGVSGLRSLICSEYGVSDEGKHLPHYHGLIIVPKCDIPSKEIEDILLSSWKFGYSFYSHAGAAVERAKGIAYVTKYCCKQIGFYEREDLIAFLNYYVDKDGYVHFDDAKYKKIKAYLPNHWQTKGFGLYIADWMKGKDLDSLIKYFSRGLGADFFGPEVEDRFYNLPRYIINKLLYKVNDKGIRVPSELGAQLAPKLFSVRLDKCEKNLKRYFTVNGLRSLIDKDDCSEVLSDKYDKFTNKVAPNYGSLASYLCEKLNGRSLRELALYMKVFRNLTLPDNDLSLYGEIEAYTPEDLECLAYVLLDAQYDESNYTYLDESAKDKGLFNNCSVWSSSPRFDGFEAILNTIQNIQSLSSKRRSAKKAQDDKDINKLKNLFA